MAIENWHMRGDRGVRWKAGDAGSSGSTSLAYGGEFMMGFEPRPVPPAVALLLLQSQTLQSQALQSQSQATRCSVP